MYMEFCCWITTGKWKAFLVSHDIVTLASVFFCVCVYEERIVVAPNLPPRVVLMFNLDHLCKKWGSVWHILNTWNTILLLVYNAINYARDELPMDQVRLQVKWINIHYLLYGITNVEDTHSLISPTLQCLLPERTTETPGLPIILLSLGWK